MHLLIFFLTGWKLESGITAPPEPCYFSCRPHILMLLMKLLVACKAEYICKRRKGISSISSYVYTKKEREREMRYSAKKQWQRARVEEGKSGGKDQKSFPDGSDGKESACNAGDLDSIPGLRRSPGEGNGYPLKHSCLENSVDRGAWGDTVHGVAKNQTWLSN